MVLKQVALMNAIGGVVGLAGALALGSAAQSLLFELKGYDPMVMAGAIAVLSAVAFGAGYVPALRAATHRMVACGSDESCGVRETLTHVTRGGPALS